MTIGRARFKGLVLAQAASACLLLMMLGLTRYRISLKSREKSDHGATPEMMLNAAHDLEEAAYLETKGLSLKNSDLGVSEVDATPESDKRAVSAPAASLHMLAPGASRGNMSPKLKMQYSPRQHVPVQQLSSANCDAACMARRLNFIICREAGGCRPGPPPPDPPAAADPPDPCGPCAFFPDCSLNPAAVGHHRAFETNLPAASTCKCPRCLLGSETLGPDDRDVARQPLSPHELMEGIDNELRKLDPAYARLRRGPEPELPTFLTVFGAAGRPNPLSDTYSRSGVYENQIAEKPPDTVLRAPTQILHQGRA